MIGPAPTLESSGLGSLALTSNTSINLITGAGATAAAVAAGETVLTGIDVHTLFPGLTIAGTNIAVGTKITAVNYDIRQITIDTPTTADQTTHAVVTISGTGDLDRTFTLGGTNAGDNLLASPIGNPAGIGKLGLTQTGARGLQRCLGRHRRRPLQWQSRP